MTRTLRIVPWHLDSSVVTCSAVSFRPPVPKVELKEGMETDLDDTDTTKIDER